MNQERYKKLTILHSNDLHGDFFAEEIDGKLIGGVSHLSGYIQQTRSEISNVIYCISGDMLQGSLIDSEYRGLSTIEIMNMLEPDVASLGNHETDYGLTHLLFLERCAKFPIVNANIFINNPYTRLFQSHLFITKDGIKIMFIGIITEEVMSHIKSDNLVSKLIDVNDAAKEVGRICNTYRSIDVDLTILLTHIGFEEDKKLASILDPAWGVDIIIGGHSHTKLEEPEIINDILIVQAVCGTDQVGRFDLTVDTDLNTVHEYKWNLIPISEDNCPADESMEKIVLAYKNQTDMKFNRLLCRMPCQLTHPDRFRETALGNLFADALKACIGADIVFFGSGAIRGKAMGPLVTLGELISVVPYNDKVMLMTVTGNQLMSMWRYILREEAFTGGHTEFFQISKGVEITWSREKQEFIKFYYLGEPVNINQKFIIAFHGFHYNNFIDSFGLNYEEVLDNGREIIAATDGQSVLVEYFTDNTPIVTGLDNRLTII